MSYTIIKKLPLPEEIIQSIPLSMQGYRKIERDREAVKKILQNKDDRLLVIVGPCSAWPNEAVIEFARRLKEIDAKVNRALKLIMRVYIQKPRTTKGWTGPVNQPDPFNPPNIALGIEYTRNMMVQVIEMGLPIADEALFTHNAKGFLELLSWVAIGARSTEDQEHRIFASAIDCAVGLKNPTHGSLLVGVNSVIAAQHPHVAVFDGYEVQTSGNPYAHLVLRGSNQEPNYSIENLQQVKQYMGDHKILNPAVIIDASHDNCMINGKKDFRRQPEVIFNILESLKAHPELRMLVKGFMVESFIKEGQQTTHREDCKSIDLSGLSITDPCLGWEDTQDMLLNLAKFMGEK
jgi:3-deoxy-7-phosphoheptulonate synthase